MRSAPEVSLEHRRLVEGMYAHCRRGWYVGDEASLMRYGSWRDVEPAATEPELSTRLCLSRDRMHHSVGWWRNAEYEYCWHLSISCWENARRGHGADPADVPLDEARYWSFAVFPGQTDKLWHEPGGTDPRLTPVEKMRHRHFVHQRLFLDPETMQPFIPIGEVYELTRWIDGLTPEKVDR